MSEEVKAYDVKVLLDELKDAGLDVAESAASEVVKAVFKWVKDSAAASETTVDDMLVGVLPVAEGWIYDQIDKIDGEEG